MTTVRRTGEWLDADVSEEVLMMHIATGRFLSLNETGGFLWRRLEAPQSLDGLVAALVEAYEVEDAEARADVLACLEALAAEQAVVIEDA